MQLLLISIRIAAVDAFRFPRDDRAAMGTSDVTDTKSPKVKAIDENQSAIRTRPLITR